MLGQSMSIQHIQFPSEDPMSLLRKENAPQATMAKNLNKEREDERIMNQLREEFARIDLSQDGSITIDELVQFLKAQTKGACDTGIAEQIFAELDEDGSGAVLLNEFIESYFIKQRMVK